MSKVLLLLLSLSLMRPVMAVLDPGRAPQAPDFPPRQAGEWINSPPLKLVDLRGRVVLLDFWTYGCVNCVRSIPWLKTVEHRYGPRGLALIGVHTPEFPHEKDPARVLEKVREFGINHPVMLDNDHRYWKAMRNRAWPAFYLIDKAGRLRAVWWGETHIGDRQAKRIEAAIERLLKE
ncbi:MAG: thioredoxin [Gammaproteobacteria bacterium]|nr:MAG: thioredoxin [Gammaproteobacteria bacterium]